MIATVKPRSVSITAALARDHVRIAFALEELEMMVEDGELERADFYFEDLERRLRRHIWKEEEILFPVFDERARLVGPTHVMRLEHRRIDALLTALHAALSHGQATAAHEALLALQSVVAEHHRKEERILYPKTDAVLDDGERAALLERLEKAPREP
jgi:iron-sulfur cluster repair protein YtfE (RIC family)